MDPAWDACVDGEPVTPHPTPTHQSPRPSRSCCRESIRWPRAHAFEREEEN
jgi:hypothetical protein